MNRPCPVMDSDLREIYRIFYINLDESVVGRDITETSA
jgi:hypothetical protein